MRTALLFLAVSLGFSATPAHLAQDLLRMTAVDRPKIEIKGTVEGVPAVPVVLSYDRATDEATFSVDGTATRLRGEKIPPWMRLFFHKKSSDKPADQAAAFLAYLSTIGIAADRKTITTTGPEGELILVIGRENARDTAPSLALYGSNHLPCRLITTEVEARFGEYHRSVLPLAFPGRVTITENGRTTTYLFLRDEYR